MYPGALTLGVSAVVDKEIQWHSLKTLQRLQIYSPKLYNAFMEGLEEQIERLAIVEDIPSSERGRFARLFRRLAERLERVDSGFVPKGYKPYGGVRVSGDPAAYLRKWWGPAIQAGHVTRKELRSADERLVMAIYRYSREEHVPLDELLPPASRELEDLSDLSPEERLERIRQQSIERKRRSRAGKPSPK